MTISDIFEELNESNSSNHKLAVLKKHKDNELLKQVLKMTYDKVQFTFGVSLQNVLNYKLAEIKDGDFFDALDDLVKLSNREITGNAALELCSSWIETLNENESEVFQRIINRDIKCNVGKTQMNKVWPKLITKPVYMRCGVYSDKTKKKIQFPAFIQLKCDGTYREFTVNNGEVQAQSRSGESYEYPEHFENMKSFPNGVYTGELTVKGIFNRSEGNGLINSDNPPYSDIIFDVWDYITLEEYKNASLKVKNTTPYNERFNKLTSIISASNYSNIQLIESHEVQNINEALLQTSEWMQQGLEGGVLKNKKAVFKDGTSTEQLKLKIQIDAEMRVIGFKDGKLGTKREGKVGSIMYQNDDNTIKGQCSGFTDKELNDMTNNPDKYLGKIITVQFNDLTLGRNHDYCGLSHPRYIELRNDKDTTNTLSEVLELRDMAICLGE